MRVPSLLRGILGIALIIMAGVFGCSSDQRKDQPENPPDLRIAADSPQPEDPNPVLPKDPEPRKETQTSKESQTSRPRAVFMGTEALGQRFCIIADASNSMKGAPLDQLKQEILKTLYDLKPGSQFYVIFFHATDVPMPSPTWLDANKENVDKVKPWIQNMTTKLKTLPGTSFDRAFKLQPGPDAIFFMTDGILQENIPAQLARLNVAEPKVAVHTIMFSRGKIAAKATNNLRIIAEKNHGTYRHVAQR